MKRTFLHKPSDLTARHDSQREEVLFFAHPHFLFFNFVATAHCTHLPLLAYAQTNPKAKSKECNHLRTPTNNKLYFKMKNILILILILSGFFNQSYGQSSYRIKPFADKGNFIYPPHSKLKHSCNETTVKKNCRYQYIYIDSLKMTNGDYYSVLNLLNNAEYFSSKYNIDKICFDTECYGCNNKGKGTKKPSFEQEKRKQKSQVLKNLEVELEAKIRANTALTGSKICNITKSDVGSFCKIKYSYDQKAFLLQIDYSSIIDGKTESEIRESFFEVAKDLLIEFQKREGTIGANRFGWPTSISQDIVEKVFELIPIPNQSLLLRYVAQIDNDKSFVLLNPKIKLKVDAVEKVKDGSNWYFNLLGTSIITINRDDKGKIIQNPFHKFQVKGMPSNQVNAKTVLQSSTEDIQLSESLRDCPFIFLWQNNFKHNNKTSSAGGCVNSETDLINCNSQLWHFDDLSSFYTTDGTKDLDYNSVKYISSYGYRNLITPVIDITINGNIIQCPLGLNLNQLRNQMAIPLSFKIYRFWDGKYVKIHANNLNNLILLPNDKIIF